MGFKQPRKTYDLVFGNDTDYPGLEVRARTLSLGQLLEVRSQDDGQDATRKLVGLFAERLVSWNLEDEEGAPVPATLDGIQEQDDDLILAVIGQWQKAMYGVPAPLESGSGSGGTSQAELALAEIPSESLAS